MTTSLELPAPIDEGPPAVVAAADVLDRAHFNVVDAARSLQYDDDPHACAHYEHLREIEREARRSLARAVARAAAEWDSDLAAQGAEVAARVNGYAAKLAADLAVLVDLHRRREWRAETSRLVSDAGRADDLAPWTERQLPPKVPNPTGTVQKFTEWASEAFTTT